MDEMRVKEIMGVFHLFYAYMARIRQQKNGEIFHPCIMFSTPIYQSFTPSLK